MHQARHMQRDAAQPRDLDEMHIQSKNRTGLRVSRSDAGAKPLASTVEHMRATTTLRALQRG